MLDRYIFLTLLAFTNLFGGDFLLVTDKASQLTQISAKQAKQIFLLQRHHINDVHVTPINTASASPARKVFEKKILHMNRVKLSRYWTKKHFEGMRPPRVQSSINSLKLFLKNVQNSLGYIEKKDLTPSLRVLYEF